MYASVLGTRFTAGEPLVGVRRAGWQTRRCGSVITTVIGGRSFYGLVKHFIERSNSTGGKFAVVEWLPTPSYPYANNPVVTCLCDGDVTDGLPAIVSILDIEPCGVGLERCNVESCWYVYRTHGLDKFIR